MGGGAVVVGGKSAMCTHVISASAACMPSAVWVSERRDMVRSVDVLHAKDKYRDRSKNKNKNKNNNKNKNKNKNKSQSRNRSRSCSKSMLKSRSTTATRAASTL